MLMLFLLTYIDTWKVYDITFTFVFLNVGACVGKVQEKLPY